VTQSVQATAAFVLPLADPAASLELVGGKGASLARLAIAGLPVPGGFSSPPPPIRASSPTADFDKMIPETILVCPTTNPAWTPLFAHARGLVTDIGGVAAHGSIVAREYGIPAVMGTGNATQRIVSGQIVTVDGDAG